MFRRRRGSSRPPAASAWWPVSPDTDDQDRPARADQVPPLPADDPFGGWPAFGPGDPTEAVLGQPEPLSPWASAGSAGAPASADVLGQADGSGRGAGSGRSGAAGLGGPGGRVGGNGGSGATGQFGVDEQFGASAQVDAPGYPGGRGHGGTPGQPGSGHGGAPGQPGGSGHGGVAGQPGAPGRDGMPGQAGAFGHGGPPGQASAPGQAGPPGQPGAPGYNGSPDYPGAPGQPGASDQPLGSGRSGASVPPGSPARPVAFQQANPAVGAPAPSTAPRQPGGPGQSGATGGPARPAAPRPGGAPGPATDSPAAPAHPYAAAEGTDPGHTEWLPLLTHADDQRIQVDPHQADALDPAKRPRNGRPKTKRRAGRTQRHTPPPVPQHTQPPVPQHTPPPVPQHAPPPVPQREPLPDPTSADPTAWLDPVAPPHPMEAAALAGAFAADYLSWDEQAPERRGQVLAQYLPSDVVGNAALLGWSGKGRQRAEFALPGAVRPDGEGRVVVDVRVRVTPYRAVGQPSAPAPAGDLEVAGVPAVAPAPTARGWKSLDSYWVRLTVPVNRDQGRLVVDTWDEQLGDDAAPTEPTAPTPDPDADPATAEDLEDTAGTSKDRGGNEKDHDQPTTASPPASARPGKSGRTGERGRPGAPKAPAGGKP